MKKRLTVLLFVLVIATGVSGVMAEETNINSEVNNQTTSGIFYDNKNNNSVSVGSVGNHPGGGFTTGPEIPLPAQLVTKQKNLISNRVIFHYMPESITTDVVENYKNGVIEERGQKFLDELQKAIDSRPYVFRKFNKTNEIRPIPGIPKNLDENKDFIKVATWQLSSLNDLPNKEDFALLLSQKGMELGADILIPYGEGAEFIFKNKGLSLGAFSAFAQVFTASLWGWNVSPNVGYHKGSNQAEALPFMEVAYLKVINPEKFWKNIDASVSSETQKKVIAKKKEASSRKEKKCDSGVGCRDIGYSYLVYFLDSNPGYKWYGALDEAMVNFRKAADSGLPTVEMDKDVYLCLSSIWHAKTKDSTIDMEDKKNYREKSLQWSKTAGTQEIPDMEKLVQAWRKEKK